MLPQSVWLSATPRHKPTVVLAVVLVVVVKVLVVAVVVVIVVVVVAVVVVVHVSHVLGQALATNTGGRESNAMRTALPHRVLSLSHRAWSSIPSQAGLGVMLVLVVVVAVVVVVVAVVVVAVAVVAVVVHGQHSLSVRLS